MASNLSRPAQLLVRTDRATADRVRALAVIKGTTIGKLVEDWVVRDLAVITDADAQPYSGMPAVATIAKPTLAESRHVQAQE